MLVACESSISSMSSRSGLAGSQETHRYQLTNSLPDRSHSLFLFHVAVQTAVPLFSTILLFGEFARSHGLAKSTVLKAERGSRPKSHTPMNCDGNARLLSATACAPFWDVLRFSRGCRIAWRSGDRQGATGIKAGYERRRHSPACGRGIFAAA